MDFLTAVKTVYVQKYASFSGRARRSEYWFSYLAYVIATAIVDVVAWNSHLPILFYVLILATFIPSWAAGVRRLHDTARSGWWLLIGVIPIVGWIIVIVWLATDGTPGDNQYGPSTKAHQLG